MTDVFNKHQNYDLWQSGAFGNRLRAWRTLEEWRESGYLGRVALRMREGHGGGLCVYNVDPQRFEWFEALEKFRRAGVPESVIMVNEMAPDDYIVLQGEYLNDVYLDGDGQAQWGYFLHSWMRRPMRYALARAPAVRQGLGADLLLRYAMTPSSYEDWRALLDQYPRHVLEVSIYDCCLGDIPGRNALVWEVRRY